jgi:hypothetical protein
VVTVKTSYLFVVKKKIFFSPFFVQFEGVKDLLAVSLWLMEISVHWTFSQFLVKVMTSVTDLVDRMVLACDLIQSIPMTPIRDCQSFKFGEKTRNIF